MAFSERLSFVIQQLGGDRVVRALDDIRKSGEKAGRSVGDANDIIEKKSSLADRALGKLGLTGKVTAGELKGGLAAGAAAAGAAVGAFLVDSAQKASALLEQVSATRITFGEASDEMERWAQTADSSLGLSARAALNAANSFGNFFKNVGISDETSAELSRGLVQLAGDLASFKDLDPGDVLEKLRSGLAGETEPLRALGVFLNEAKVQSKAMELGLGGAHGELSDGAKILARYSIILDKTKDAQGDLARTSDSLANQQREQTAQWENFQATVGKVAIPTLAGFTGEANKSIGVVDMLASKVGGAGKVFETAGRTAFGMIPFWGDLSRAQDAFGDSSENSAKSLEEALAVYHDLVMSGTEGEGALADAKKDVVDAANREIAAQNTLSAVMSDTTDKVREQAEAYQRLDKRLRERTQAVSDLPDSQRDLASALDDVAEAEQALADARSGPDPAEVADAEDALASARLSTRDATDALADAQDRLNELRRDAPDPLELARKEQRAAEARTGQKKADVELREAQEELERVRRAGAGADYVEEAELKVEEAQNRVTDASLDTREAQKELDDARRGSATRAKEIERAERDVERAAIAVREARRGEKTAEDELDRVRNPDRVRAIRDAENELADAVERAADASQRVAENQQKISATAATTGETVLRTQIGALMTLLSLLPAGSPAATSIQTAIDDLSKLLPSSGYDYRAGKGQLRQHGGPVWPGTWLVGERGPELLSLNGSGTVHSASETTRMLGGGSRVFSFEGANFYVADLAGLIHEAEERASLANLTFFGNAA